MGAINQIYNIQLQIDSQLEHVRLLGSALRGIGDELELSHDQVGQLELILVEAVNNIIEHAYEYQAGHQVHVEMTCTPDESVKLTLSDQGKSMPEAIAVPAGKSYYSDIIAPELPEPESLPESGWGMGLIGLLADSFRYERNNEHNYWHVTKQLA